MAFMQSKITPCNSSRGEYIIASSVCVSSYGLPEATVTQLKNWKDSYLCFIRNVYNGDAPRPYLAGRPVGRGASWAESGVGRVGDQDALVLDDGHASAHHESVTLREHLVLVDRCQDDASTGSGAVVRTVEVDAGRDTDDGDLHPDTCLFTGEGELVRGEAVVSVTEHQQGARVDVVVVACPLPNGGEVEPALPCGSVDAGVEVVRAVVHHLGPRLELLGVRRLGLVGHTWSLGGICRLGRLVRLGDDGVIAGSGRRRRLRVTGGVECGTHLLHLLLVRGVEAELAELVGLTRTDVGVVVLTDAPVEFGGDELRSLAVHAGLDGARVEVVCGQLLLRVVLASAGGERDGEQDAHRHWGELHGGSSQWWGWAAGAGVAVGSGFFLPQVAIFFTLVMKPVREVLESTSTTKSV